MAFYLFLLLPMLVVLALPILLVWLITHLINIDTDKRYARFAQSLAKIKTDACADLRQPAEYLDYEKSSYFHERGFWTYYLIVKSCPHTFWHCLTLCNDRQDSDGYVSGKKGTFKAKLASMVAAYYSQILKIDPNRVSVLMEPRHLLNSVTGIGMGEQPKICFNLSVPEQDRYKEEYCKIPDVKEAGRMRAWAKANPVKIVPIKDLKECRPLACDECKSKTAEPRAV